MNLRRDVFQAIADPTRRAILLLVASQSMTAGAIASNFEYSPTHCFKTPSNTNRMRITQTRTKRQRDLLSLKPDKDERNSRLYRTFSEMWDDRFNKLESIMKKYKSKK
jgi:DNA-binding transcriptional ArsR family regulator